MLLGKYQVEAFLGQGGMASVVCATDVTLDRRVALKILDPELARDSDFVSRFYREAKVMARLEHPNIIPVYAVEGQGTDHFIAMKLLQGQPLTAWANAPQSLTWVSAVFSQLTSALDYLHRRGFIHRDLKPGNVFVDEAGHVTLLDLGVVRASSSALTQPGVVIGTPGYMAPEQITDPNNIDHRADLFALGVVAFQLLTGQFPFPRMGIEALARRMTEPAPSPARFRSDLPPEVSEVVRGLLNPDREGRPASAGAFYDAFALAIGRPTNGANENTVTASTTTTERSIRGPDPAQITLDENIPGQATVAGRMKVAVREPPDLGEQLRDDQVTKRVASLFEPSPRGVPAVPRAVGSQRRVAWLLGLLLFCTVAWWLAH